MKPDQPSKRKSGSVWIALALGILVLLVIIGVIVGVIISSSNPPIDQVAALTPQPGGYDLAAYACQAEWFYPSYMFSIDDTRPLCGSKRLPSNGLVLPLETVVLNTGETVGPVLWLEKAAEREFLAAEYPLYTVQPGDHFTARIGCAQDQPHCAATIAISFIDENRHIAQEAPWVDIHFDQPPVDVDIDLSALTGQQVFISLHMYPSFQISSLCQATIIAPRIGP